MYNLITFFVSFYSNKIFKYYANCKSKFIIAKLCIVAGIISIVLLSNNDAYAQQYWGNQMMQTYSEPIGSGQQSMYTAAKTVKVIGNMAFVVDLYGFNVVDISSPSNPQIIGRVGTPGMSHRMVIRDNIAFIVEYEGMTIVDFSIPTDPYVVSFTPINNTGSDIVVSGELAFVGTKAAVEVIDIGRLDSPVPVSTFFTPTADQGNHLEIHPTLPILYCAGSGSPRTMYVLDVSNPNSIQVDTTFEIPYSAAVWTPPIISGNKLYINSTLRLNIYDISVPTHPVQLYTGLPTSGTIYSSRLQDTLFIAAHWQQRFSIISVANPNSPYLIKAYNDRNIWGDGYGIAEISGNYLFMANFGRSSIDAGWRVRIIDISNPAAAFVVGDIVSPQAGYPVAHKIITRNNRYYALVAEDNTTQSSTGQTTYSGLLSIVDVTDPSSPTILSTLEIPRRCAAIESNGSVAIVLANSPGTLPYYFQTLYVVSLADLQNPYIAYNQELAQSLLIDDRTHLRIFENRFYVLEPALLKVFQIDNNLNLIILGSTSIANANPNRAIQLRRIGQNIFAYIASGLGLGGFTIYNVTNPNAMYAVSSFDTPGQAYDIWLENNYAYVALGDNGIQVFDISNNTTVPVGSVSTLATARNVIVENNLAFVRIIGSSSFDKNIQVFDISDPIAWVDKGVYRTEGVVQHLSTSHNGRRLYISDNYSFTVRRPLFNFAPLPFTLVQPSNGSLVQNNVNFAWKRSEDANDDTINYSLKIWNANWDTTFANISDTSFTADSSLLSPGTYNWTVFASDGLITKACTDTFHFTFIVTDIAENGEQIPNVYALYQNFPNPFNPSTKIKYDLPKTSSVRIEIFNSLGKHVKTLLNKQLTAGTHTIEWDGTSTEGNFLSSGVYLLRINAKEESGGGESFIRTLKLVLLR